MFRCKSALCLSNNSSTVNPFLFANSTETAQHFPVFSISSSIMKYHGSPGNLTPIHPSAPNLSENVRNCSISSLKRYFLVSAVTLHSMATRRMAFPARISGEGYLLLPEPAARMQTQPFSLNTLTNSRSPFEPLALVFMKVRREKDYLSSSSLEFIFNMNHGHDYRIYSIIFPGLSSFS